MSGYNRSVTKTTEYSTPAFGESIKSTSALIVGANNSSAGRRTKELRRQESAEKEKNAAFVRKAT